MNCQKCGANTRRVQPVYVHQPKGFPSDDTMLPRGAFEDGMAALPWGQHPRDFDFENWCPDCARAAA
jgi:hypothetical protein